MRWRRLNNALHRDLGYFFAGTAILYAVSGLALNHVDHWNPSFVVDRREVLASVPDDTASISQAWVLDVLEQLGQADHYRAHDFASPGRPGQQKPTKLKIYLDDGSVFLDLGSGEGELEIVRRRPVFYSMNLLHLNPTTAWLVFSDIFAVGLILVSLSGLFVLKGRQGIGGRGAILAGTGAAVPILFILLV